MVRPDQAGDMADLDISARWYLRGGPPDRDGVERAGVALPVKSGSAGRLVVTVCGLSHHSAPIEILEQLAFGPEARQAALIQLRAGSTGAGLVSEAVILSTCNRVEVYAVLERTAARANGLAGFMADFHGVPLELVAPHLYCYEGEDAVRHLFSVAGGLDSLILGEPQILGQVRRAFAESQDIGASGSTLSTLFRRAIQTGKRIHCETGISHGAASVSYAAAEIAARHHKDLAGCHALIVGAGKTGQLTAQCLLGQGVQSIAVANRSYDRAIELADNWGGIAYGLEDLDIALPSADIVISCTDAPGYVVSREQVAQALALRADRPLVLVDIAVPRDIEPAAGSLPGVRLYNIEDLQLTIEENMAGRGLEGAQAEAIVDEQVAEFMAWLVALSVKPLIVDLREHAEMIRQRELERVQHRLPDLPPEYAPIIDMMTQRIVNQLLHEPTVRLKNHASHLDGQLYARVIRDLFALDSDQGRE